MVEMSKEMKDYFNKIQQEVDKCYELAGIARGKGYDPDLEVESPQAKDLAGRVEKLVGPEGVAKVIRELKSQGKSDDEIVFQVVSDILDKKIGDIGERDMRVERAIRVGLAIKTMGVVSAPLEGISKIQIKEDNQNNRYLSLFFAGPIRAAGGTTAALCVLIADFVRRKSNIPKYKATNGEIGRYLEEVKMYDRKVHLQYPSSRDELRFAVKHLPVEINGDSTEQEEVTAFRNLPRIETNNIRGGACLVLNDGILLKAPKLLKIARKMNLEGWEWLGELKKIALRQKKEKKEEKKEESEEKKDHKTKILPNDKYVADIIAGRPVFGHPSRMGGHRIRYGRSRNTGLAAGGFHPATMAILDDFIAIGTQLRIERPGKSTSICPVDSIEPPIVKLKNGNVIKVKSRKKAKRVFKDIKKVLFLGDILFGYGEFAENNHKLVPSGYVEEWWGVELENAVKASKETPDTFTKYIKDPFNKIPQAAEAIKISRQFDIPLHPAYTDFWGNISVEEAHELRTALLNNYKETQDVYLPNQKPLKRILEKAFILHRVKDGKLIFSRAMQSIYREIFHLEDSSNLSCEGLEDVFSYFYKLSSLRVRNKAPYFMGTRMGRPEKSQRKSMKGIHTLFPLSHKVGSTRLVEKALEFEKIKIDVCRKKCKECGTVNIFNKCPNCGEHTKVQQICENCGNLEKVKQEKCSGCGSSYLSTSKEAVFNIKNYILPRLKEFKMSLPDKMKGIYGLTNRFKVPEPIEKGLLRAKNGVLVYKTAELRYDATDIPLTHFKPKEIKVSVSKLQDLGYAQDHLGNSLKHEDQIVELKAQDVILSYDCAKYFVKEANFLDDELEQFYKMDPYYHVSKPSDLIGHLCVGLAPHTSAGVIGRIIGFSPARSIYAHPYWHAAKRRNCFPGETKILIDLGNQVKKITIKQLYEDYFEGEYFDKMGYVKQKQNCDIQVYSFDKESAKIRKTKIKSALKLPHSKKLIKFKLITGRSFKTTPDHPVIVYSNGEIVEKKAIEVTKEDKFLLPSLKFPIKNKEKFDLLYEFNKEKFQTIWDDLMIRGIREFVKQIVSKWGLEQTAKTLEINKKTLNNYYGVRDSVPFSILRRLLSLHNLKISDIPNCTLGFKRDHTTIKRFIPVNESVMKICGYYIAEGSYRKEKDTYQVDLTISEKDLRKDMLNSIFNSFGDGFQPYFNKNRITISNRVLYYFFKEILKFENKARVKSIPAFFFKLPKHKIKYLLSAYFSVDIGLDTSHKIVVCSSSSTKLIQDIDLMLLRFGIFGAISHYSERRPPEYKFRIRGRNVFKFHEEIGFTSPRKTKILEDIVKTKKTNPERTYKTHRLLRIRNIQQVPFQEEFVYSLHAEKYHTILVNENIITHQCDGDEDGIMLLLDPLLNFSRYYLPNKIGGRMDATLVIGTFLDPKEVDTEAHNVDTLFQYPLEFYEATQRYATPDEVEEMMGLVGSRLGQPNQYEGIGYNIPTSDINEGPTVTAYKKYQSMDEKLDAQLHLAKIIKAVDPKSVGSKILSSHFNPDILGNLRKFGQQEFRCVKCNTKFRRPPLANNGRCPKCGGNIILTVNAGGIEKYIPRALKICKEFKLDNYTVQKMELINEYVQSLTDNPRIKQQKLSDFL
ncbi:MAG: DNA-directed DNA polymerase II large subunit [Promethearchaeia archaeon]